MSDEITPDSLRVAWTRAVTAPTESDRRFAALLDEHVRKHRDALAPLYALHRTHRITSEIENLPGGGMRVTYTATPIATEPPHAR